MRILLVNPHKSIVCPDACGGGERLLLSTHRALKQRRFSVEIALRSGVIPDAVLHKPGNEDIFLEPYIEWIAHIASMFDMVVLFELPEALPYVTVPVVCWFMNERTQWLPATVHRHVELLFVSEAHRKLFIAATKSIKHCATTIVPPFVEQPISVKRVYSSNNEPRRILCASMWHPCKGILEYLNALILLEKRGCSFKATLAGDTSLWGPKDDIQSFFPEKERKDFHKLVMHRASKVRSLEVVGKLCHTQLLRLLSDIDIFCLFSSFREGIPISLLESLSRGATVVATEVGGIPEVVGHEENGLLVSPGSVTCAADNLARLCDDPYLCMRLQKTAPNSISKFREEAVMKSLFASFEHTRCRFNARG